MDAKLEINAENESHYNFPFEILDNFPFLREFNAHIGMHIKGGEYNLDSLVTKRSIKRLKMTIPYWSDDLPSFFASGLIRYIDWIDVLQPLQELLAGCPIQFSSYKTLLSYMPDQTWLLNKAMLQIVDLRELFGYTGDFIEILEPLLQKMLGEDDDEIRNHFSNQLIPLALEQVRNCGNTLFFDVEKLINSRDAYQARLAAYIVLRRKKEIDETVIVARKNDVDLSPLWLTHYGFSTLRALGLGKQCTETELENIRKILSKEELYFNTTTKKSSVNYGPKTPSSFANLLFSRLVPTVYESVDQRLSRLADFESSLVNPASALFYDNHWYRPSNPSEEEKYWIKKRNTAGILIGFDYENVLSKEFTFMMP